MGRNALGTSVIFAGVLSGFCATSAAAQDLIWQVENPFRFFKGTRSFAIHEAAYNAVRGSGAIPSDIIWRTERKLNDPDCRDTSSPDRCADTAGPRYQQSRQGWASQTVNDTCYEVNGRPRRYPTSCDRRYTWGTTKEDYVVPEAHTVVIQIAPAQLGGVTGECLWGWMPRKAGGKVETKKLPCKDKLTIARVPFSLDKAQSGVVVSVKLPDGRELSDRNVVVEDLFVVAMGDSFSSGESNPDKPVQFSPSRQMVYDPALLRDEVASVQGERPGMSSMPGGFGLASGEDQINPKVLPRRLMEDELKERFNRPGSPEFEAAFYKASAQWLSRDCHRSQYGYPFRVGIQLALENRHRAITFASFSCSGAEVAYGLFLEMDAREGYSDPAQAKVRPQLDQLADLICRGGAAARTQQASYTLPMFKVGDTNITPQRITKSWCPPAQRKRNIDVVLMSIGGNDVGFGGLIAYGMTESAADFAPIAAAIGKSIRFGPQVSRAYMNVLDQRMKALKDAFQEGFGISPSRVFQSSYEPIQNDETGGLCGAQPTLGMDVHTGLKLNRQRLQETSDFLRDFLGRMECIAGKGNSCPALATGAGTGFNLVTDHIPEFTKRGICARDPKRALADGINMRVPRLTPNGEEWKPYSPAATIPYAHNWRLFRTPNDAFLAAHTHREGLSLFDILQPAWAGLYSGAIHPTAEAHAIVADHMVKHVRQALAKSSTAENAAR